jgi:iron complex outermembrane receptor protein
MFVEDKETEDAPQPSTKRPSATPYRLPARGTTAPAMVLSAPLWLLATALVADAETTVVGRALGDAAATVDVDGAAEAGPVGAGTASDLLRNVPGVFLSQHSGQGKAHQLFLRGFDAEHGQDVELSIGGVPANDVSNVHGQGYADVTFVPVELVRALRVTPGAIDVRQGDFAVAGSVDLDIGFAPRGLATRFSAGEFGVWRGFAGYGFDDDDDDTFVGAEAARGAGFGTDTSGVANDNRAFGRASALFATRLSLDDSTRLAVQLLSGVSQWQSAGVLRRADIADIADVDDTDDTDDGAGFAPFSSYDEEQGGSAQRHHAGVRLVQRGEVVSVDVDAYAIARSLRLAHNFTGVLLNARGDRVQQRHDAVTLGGSAEARARTTLWGRSLTLAVGTKLRGDDADQGQVRLSISNNASGAPRDVDVNAAFRTLHAGLYTELRAVPVEGLVVVAGLRGEALWAGVDDRRDAAGEKIALGGVLAPRARVAWRVVDVDVAGRADPADDVDVVVRAAYGEGFRTPQARSLGDLEVAQLTRVHNGDLGVNARVGDAIDVDVDAFVAHVASDRVFDHASARNLFLGPTLRTGVVVAAHVAPGGGLRVGASTSVVRATILDAAAIGGGAATLGSTVPYAPPLVARVDLGWRGEVGRGNDGAADDAVIVGVDVDPWLVGGRPLPLGDISAPIAAVDVAASVSWRTLTLAVEAQNATNNRFFDGEFVYASDFRFAGGGGGGLPVRHVTVASPRQVSLSLAVGF